MSKSRDHAASEKENREKQKQYARKNKILGQNIRRCLKNNPGWTDKEIALSVSEDDIPSWRFRQIVKIASQQRAKMQRDR